MGRSVMKMCTKALYDIYLLIIYQKTLTFIEKMSKNFSTAPDAVVIVAVVLVFHSLINTNTNNINNNSTFQTNFYNLMMILLYISYSSRCRKKWKEKRNQIHIQISSRMCLRIYLSLLTYPISNWIYWVYLSCFKLSYPKLFNDLASLLSLALSPSLSGAHVKYVNNSILTHVI